MKSSSDLHERIINDGVRSNSTGERLVERDDDVVVSDLREGRMKKNSGDTTGSRSQNHKRKFIRMAQPTATSASVLRHAAVKKPLYQSQPRRNTPGFLWTCDTGLERKCRHQAFEILQYYCNRDPSIVTSEKAKSIQPKLTLDEELAYLKGKPYQVPFSVYETKCKGTVIMLCTSSSSCLSPEKVSADCETIGDHDGNDSVKHLQTIPQNDETQTMIDASEVSPLSSSVEKSSRLDIPFLPWDPVETVNRVISGIRETARLELDLVKNDTCVLNTANQRNIPSSRFITRMIPIQTSCYASKEQIKVAFIALLHCYMESLSFTSRNITGAGTNLDLGSSDDPPNCSLQLPMPNHTTYMVQCKRRHCNHLRSKDVIECVAELVPSTWKVDLRQPEVVVWVEICTNLAGLSILSAITLSKVFNFNLLQARTSNLDSE